MIRCLPLACAALLLLALPAGAHAPPPYRLYAGDGRPVTLDAVATAAWGAEALFLGEQHDDPAAHALEADLLAAVIAARPEAGEAAGRGLRPLALSLEMFERDVQLPLDEYLAGQVREKDFLAAARPWKAYATDYRPLVELARASRLPVIAANAPHRYVTRVGREGLAGLAGLSGEARGLLAPLPLPSPGAGYAQRFAAFAAGAPAPSAAGGHANAAGAMFEAQWLRDATMAEAVARHLRARPGGLVVHVCGAFHSEGRQGTPEALVALRPGTRMLVLTIARDAGYPAFAQALGGKGDFVAVTPDGPR